jgi:hypothetical protein
MRRSKKEDFEKINESLKEELDNNRKSIVIKNPGGSINNLPVKTPEYQKWLEEKRKKNPLIGSEYVNSAPEYSTEMVMMDTGIHEMGQEELDNLDAESGKEFNSENVENDTTPVLVNDSEEALVEDDTDKTLIDYSIIQNTTKKLLGKPIDEIKRDIVDELKKYHADENYVTGVDMEKAIKHSEMVLIESKNNKKQLPK